MPKYRVSIDIGGTFTDLIAFDEESGDLVNIKVPSTPKRLAYAVVESLEEFLREAEPKNILVVTHATTVATNALLGQLGLELPKVALITTRGFRDVIEIGRQRRHELYNLFIQRPKMLVPRKSRFEVDERIGANGDELKPLNVDDVYAAISEIREQEIKSVAIGFLNSYVNSDHEEKVREMLHEFYPGVYTTPSYEVSPEYREYERFSTTVVNACLMPIVSTYLNEVVDEIEKLGVHAPFYVMQSSGGIASKDTVAKKPASMIGSGPAAGVIASAFYGKLLSIENILSFDMGGTTAKAGIIHNYTPETVTEYEVGGKVHSGRIVKGSGYPVRFPFIDLAECSAGGGTIAWVDDGGYLRVGPVGAGAEPGPACYGLGGEDPTVTDANLVLGRLNQEYLLGGRVKVYPSLAKKSIDQKICEKVRLDLVDAASGIIRIINSDMAKILRIVSVERGHDPRLFTLIAFGGAGPMHACALAEELGIPSILVVINPGLFSALGLIVGDFTHNLIKPIMKQVPEVDTREIENVFQYLEEKGKKMLQEEKVSRSDMVFSRQLDARYFGQAYEIMIPTYAPITDDEVRNVIKRFHSKHRMIYGYAAEEEFVEVVNARVVASGIVAKPKLRSYRLGEQKAPKDAVLTTRSVFFEKYNDYVSCPVYIREKLRPGNLIEGPAVIEQYDSTTVVYPDWNVKVDRFRNLCLEHG